MAAFGLPVTRQQNNVVDLWPENSEVFDIFLALDDQWMLLIGASRTGWQAPSHADAWATMKFLGVKKRKRRTLFNALIEMEQAALAELNAP